MDTPVLKPGGFWICPSCGQRNKVWAPCSQCGTALADMAGPAAAVPEPPPESARPRAARRSAWLYVLMAAGLLIAAGIAVALTRLFGGATLSGVEPAVAARPRAAATPLAPVATPVPLPVETAPLSPPVREYVPATPPPAVYTPSVQPPMPATPPAWSVPAPARPADTLRGPIGGGRAGIELRAREQAVRAAQARYRRAEAAASSVENADGEADGAVLEELEQAARDLRQAEAALDRVRRRPAR